MGSNGGYAWVAIKGSYSAWRVRETLLSTLTQRHLLRTTAVSCSGSPWDAPTLPDSRTWASGARFASTGSAAPHRASARLMVRGMARPRKESWARTAEWGEPRRTRRSESTWAAWGTGERLVGVGGGVVGRGDSEGRTCKTRWISRMWCCCLFRNTPTTRDLACALLSTHASPSTMDDRCATAATHASSTSLTALLSTAWEESIGETDG